MQACAQDACKAIPARSIRPKPTGDTPVSAMRKEESIAQKSRVGSDVIQSFPKGTDSIHPMSHVKNLSRQGGDRDLPSINIENPEHRRFLMVPPLPSSPTAKARTR